MEAAMFRAILLSMVFLFSLNIPAGDLPFKYEELSALQLAEAREKSGNTVIIPIGILEKHGPHMPLGTDLLDVRETVFRAVNREYSVVFPPYYFSQIYEAKHQPGAIAYSPGLTWQLLQETCDELGRNGFTKIIFVNGHGGNIHFLPYFCQAQLERCKNYAVILFQPNEDSVVLEKVSRLRKTKTEGHACEIETSMIMSHRPDLAHPELGKKQSGDDLKRLDGIPYAYTGIWWYARFPNHYAGDGSQANPEIGNLLIDSESGQLSELIGVLKKDNRILELQGRFYQESENPSETKQ
jgi:creatinine amidohydrolase